MLPVSARSVQRSGARRSRWQPGCLAIEERVIFEDFIEGSTGREKLQHVGDENALPASAGTPTAPAVLDCDSVKALLIHRCGDRVARRFASSIPSSSSRGSMGNQAYRNSQL